MNTLSRRVLRAVCIGIVVALVYPVVALPGINVGAASSNSCQLTWQAVSAAQLGASTHALNAVHALAANDVWAVGYKDNASTLIEHWNGSIWSVVPGPVEPAAKNYLNDLAGTANDLWAVGHTEVSLDDYAPLILHWDGTRWSIVSGANLSGDDGSLSGVAFIAPNDV